LRIRLVIFVSTPITSRPRICQLKACLDLLGVDLAAPCQYNGVHGITIEKDDLILDPEQIPSSPAHPRQSHGGAHSG